MPILAVTDNLHRSRNWPSLHSACSINSQHLTLVVKVHKEAASFLEFLKLLRRQTLVQGESKPFPFFNTEALRLNANPECPTLAEGNESRN